MRYDFDLVHNRCGTYSTQWDYIQDRFGESDLLPFSISDTDFEAPTPVIRRIHEIADRGVFGYTRWNHRDFKGCVTSFFARRFDLEVPQDWITYSPSVMYAIAVLIRMLSKPDEGVVALNPLYDAFINVVTENDRMLLCSNLIANGRGSFSIDFDDLEKKLARARIMLLCSPHNPTGRVWNRDELGRIISLCREHDVAIISDEIHMDLVLGDNRQIPVLSFYRDYPRICAVSSCSKTLNVPSLIGSYAMLPFKKIRDEFLNQTRRRDFLNSASLFGMHAHLVGYTECDDYIDQLVSYVQSNMVALKSFVDHELPRVVFHIPDATYLAWLDVHALPFNSETLQRALVHIGRVGIMPGETYGSGGKGYLRMNCGCPRSKLDQGLCRLKRSIDFLDRQTP